MSRALFVLCSIGFGIAVLCILLLLLITIIYGEPRGITMDPNDFRLEKGHASYMTESAYSLYIRVWGLLVHIGWISAVWGFVIYGIRFLLMKKTE
jgi:hypothetical protein